MTEPVLSVAALRLTLGGVSLVDGVSFDVASGEIVALVGESGCGKSVTALAILKLLAPAIQLAGGRVALAGRDLGGLSEAAMAEVRGREASIIFQEPAASLDPLMPVGKQIVEALRAHEAISPAGARRRALEMLASVGISDAEKRLNQYPFELSGGMCQRIMISIALICGPKLLIADEPTTALDVTIQAQILHLIRELVARRGTSVLLITHDMGVVADMADRVVVMYAGRVAEIAPVDALFAGPRHPYTHLLLKSLPRLDQEPKAELTVIDGTVPSPQNFGAGCRFASRCPLAEPRCRADQPPLTEAAPGHAFACWRSGDVAALRTAA